MGRGALDPAFLHISRPMFLGLLRYKALDQIFDGEQIGLSLILPSVDVQMNSQLHSC